MYSLSEYLTKFLATQHLGHDYQQLMTQALQDPEVKAFLSHHQEAIAPGAIEKSASSIYEFYQVKAGLNPEEVVSQAGYEPYLLMNNGLIEVAYRPTVQAAAAHSAQARRQRVTMVNLPQDLRAADLADYRQTAGRKSAINAAMVLLRQLSQPSDHPFARGLYLTGPFGVGKTYLMGALANELSKEGLATTLVHFPTFATQIKQAISAGQVWPQIQKIQSAPVLIIDDIGADSNGPWVRDEVLGVILQYRMQERLTTCFTSNLAMAELETFLADTRQTTDLLKAKRLMERIRFLAAEITMQGPNLRQATAQTLD
ncbi:primosomal protein DnaI [Lapidilactobacillus luobeiensis]|uniref:primosomal protein DnaI n=1 Tax=Lapidilactobacillus luobeiensis TaxID=2950371 RepID=UPI0021C37E71|nr:primosomal protein DnaI [Lapidilactobacillus luobeiensis]